MEGSAPDTTECSISLVDADNTSPSQLQEVTLDQDVTTFSNTMGLRSPGGAIRGRSVKEIEEQLSNLKKENFNLKLRIYFLEEKMGTNFTLDKDNIVKKNIELQIEIANLQKEVQEKHELLCQAVKAMELEDEEHKKYIASKEEQLNMCQQELEDLRIQLQDTKFDSDGISIKSDTTGFYSSRATSSGNTVKELQERIRVLETELHLEKENNASLQFVIGQAETLKCRYENMQKEFQAKDETIRNLHEEIEAANEKIMGFPAQMKEIKDKLDNSYRENQSLQKKIQVENKKFEEIMCQISELRKKYSIAKAELEREQKKLQRMKILNEMKVSELEDENQKQKLKIRDLQTKLEASLVELRKSQNSVVSKSPTQKSNTSNTDVNYLSVSPAAATPGSTKKNTLLVQINSPVKSPVPSSPLSSEKINMCDFEELLNGAGEQPNHDKILSYFQMLKKENVSQNQKIIKLKSEQMKACEIIKNMIKSRDKANDDISKLKAHIKELEHELESVVTKPASEGDSMSLKQRIVEMNIKAVKPDDERSMAESQCEDVEIAEHYKALTVELETKIDILVATLNEKDVQMQKIRQQYEEILTSLEEKENRIVDLEFELVSADQDGKNVDQSLLEKSDTSSEKHSSFYRQEIEEKDKEIEKLTVELKKCTCYLQEIVNKELWDKNKEIEKLHNKQANSSEIMKLKKDLTGKDLQLKVLKEKISELGLDINITTEDSFESKDLLSPSKNIHHIRALQDQLKACKEERDYFKENLEKLETDNKNHSGIIEKLQLQVETLGTEIEKSESLRQKSNEVCAVLNTRLEELAVFLDSLLKQKSILGFLGIHKERKLREIINTSLDLSKTFAMSMIINPEESLTQLSNITMLLNGSAFQDLTLDNLQPEEDEKNEEEDGRAILSIVPTNVTLTYQSHLYKRNKNSEPNSEEVISALREQIFNLKSELQLRDNELNRLTTLREISDKTTETDNEMRKDLNTSFHDTSKLFISTVKYNTTSTTLKYQTECQSESEAWSEPDRVVSKARIGLSQTLPSLLKDINCNESTEDESRSSTTPTRRSIEKRQSYIDLHQQISELQDKVKIKTEELRNAEEKFIKLNDLETKLKETENRFIEMDRRRAEAENQAVALKKLVDDLMKSKQELEESMVVKNKETQNKINQLELDKDHAIRAAQDFEKEVEETKKIVQEVEVKLKYIQVEKFELEDKLRKEYEQFAIAKLKDAEVEFLKRLKNVEETSEERVNQLREEYCRDYVRKSEVENKLNEVNTLQNQMYELKNIVKSYEETIDALRVKEHDIGRKLQEYQEKNTNLRKELDNTTLQYSEAVLEKSKLTNEKALLEQELSKYNMRDADLKQQVSDIRSEFADCQRQISSLQKQKSKLEVKISELESTNAELHNKLVKLQANRSDFNSSLPNFGSKNISVLPYKRQYSDQNYSSEDNIEECSGFSFGHPAVRNLQPVDIERHEANSSPDLGIESDHGRFSSLETHTNTSRPLLHTLELTESMSNLLGGEHNAVESVSCESEHCCQRTLEIAYENNDLKKKLQKMRRALQDTLNQLNLANQRKKQVEKTICKQIHKTSQVLRKAKANLDSGSESDIFNKS